ncbi:MAG TPA: response regulator [Woeseiaceae bacterium]|nr:response regulator [Woeseiaceae bacterium]
MNAPATVFVVEDDAAVRRALSVALRERGYTVESFASAEAFLEAGCEGRAGCLLLDIRMPGIGGLELQDRLKRADSALPVIFITAHANVPMAVSAVRKGAFDFLEKPYDLDALIDSIDAAVASDRLQRETQEKEAEARRRYRQLSTREREVLALLIAGPDTSNRAIAGQLGISHRTVETYRGRLMQKMGARSLVELARIAALAESREA